MSLDVKTSLFSNLYAELAYSDSELAQRWTSLSLRLGGLVPNSLMISNLQEDGRLDQVCRNLENLASKNHSNPTFSLLPSFLNSLSRYWVLSLYESLRVLKEELQKGDRWQDSSYDNLREVFRKIELVRIPLAKHEIAKEKPFFRDNKTLWLEKLDPKPEEKPLAYRPGTASYIPVLEFNPITGSICWNVANLKTKAQEVVERRAVSDLLLNVRGQDRKSSSKPA